MSSKPTPEMGTQGDVLGRRIAAFLVDAILFGIVAGLLSLVVGALLGGRAGGAVAALFGAVGFFAYFIYFEGSSGQTIGKRLLDIVVVKEDGTPLGYGGAAIRTLLRIIDALPTLYIVGLVLILVTDDSQRLGDIAADSVVVRAG